MKKLILLIAILFSIGNTFAQESTISIAGKSGGDITVNEILNNNLLEVENNSAKVVMFNISIIAGDVFTNFSNMGNTFTDEQILIIKNLSPKSVIYIKQIKMRDTNNKILESPDLKFVIVEEANNKDIN